MVRCSLGQERPVPWAQLPRPTWWPKKLPFRMPTANNTGSTLGALVGLVQRCYTFHGCEYLLQFCASLVSQKPESGYRFNDNRDGTTSMYHGSTGKLLVTFRNENRDYDKFSQDGRSRDSTKKLLLSTASHSGERKGSSGTTAMFQPPANDIYLCDKCENEFYSLREVQVQNQKKGARGTCRLHPLSRPQNLPLSEDKTQTRWPKVPFLAYLSLQPAKHTGIEPYMSPRKRSSSSPPRKIPGPMYPRYDSIAISSPLGRFLFSHSKFRNRYQASQHNVMRYERHLHATPHTDFNFSRERCNSRWIVVWRDRKEEQPWFHLYCFTSGQRRERRITINTGLNWRSRRLLRLCRPLKIKLKRLQKRLVDRIMRLGGPTAPCIDLTEECQADNKWIYDGYQTLLPNSNFISSGTASWSNENIQLGTGEDLFTPEASSSGRVAGTMQWLCGLPQITDDVCAPGGSGILHSGGILHNRLSSKYNPDLDLSELNASAAIQQSSLKFIPVSSPGNQHFTSQRLQSAFAQQSHLSQLSKNELGQTSSYPVDGTGFPLKLSSSSSADISLIPLNSPIMHNSSNSKVNSDILKPLSRKKYGICDPQSNVQGLKVSEGSHSDLRTGVKIPSGVRYGSSDYQGQNRHHTPIQTEKMPKGSQNIYSHLVPHISERDSSTVSLDNTSISLSSLTHNATNSIEIIDLSSDDDDIRARGQSEADNAPQQLDGLACYPHTGAKVPDSSDYSLSKNGSSHWSSKQKSHCGAGRVGDLATNGEPPNVPPSIANSPVPRVLFLPNATVPPPVTQGPETKGNSRKRKSKEPPRVGGKMIILDVSNKGVKMSTEREVTDTSPLSKGFVSNVADNQITVIPEEIIPATPEELNSAHLSPLTEATLLKVLNKNGAFGSRKYSHKLSEMFIIDKDISFKSPFNVDEDISFSIPPAKCSNTEYNNTTEPVTPLSTTDAQDKHCTAVEAPGDGIIGSIVNTFNKGVDLLKSVIGIHGSSDTRHKYMGSLTLSENVSCRCHSRMSSVGKSFQEENTAKQSVEVSYSEHSRKEKCLSMEVLKLLGDECRELRCMGLGELRHLNLQDTRLTRRSLERFIPNKARRKNSISLNYCQDLNPTNNCENVTTSRLLSTDNCNFRAITESKISGTSNSYHLGPSVIPRDYIPCTDENGNSSSYLTFDENSYENSPKNVSRQGSFGLYSENTKEYRETIIDNALRENGYSDKNNQNRLVNTSNKLTKSIVHSELPVRDQVETGNKNSDTARGINDVPSMKRRLGNNISTTELLNLAHDEWKEMQHKGFHPVKNITPALMTMGQLKEHRTKLQKCIKKFKISHGNSMFVKELQSLARDSEEISCMGLHHSKFVNPEVKKVLKNTQCETVEGKVRDGVEVSVMSQSDVRPEFMGETAEECGALQAQIPAPEESQIDKCSDKYDNVPLVRSTAEKNSAANSLSIKTGKVEVSESTAQPKAQSTKPRRFKSLHRELTNLGKDEYKELRGTGFHPSDFVGLEDVKYLNTSSDEDDPPIYHSKTKSPNRHRSEKVQNSDTRGRKTSEKLVKMNRELSGLLSDECKELKRIGRCLLKSSSHFRRHSHLGSIKRLVGERDYRTTRSTLPTASVKPSLPILLKSGIRGSPTKTRMRCQARSTRSQSNVVSSYEVYTIRNSHRQILRTETAMCVLNYILPVIH
nr:uncharacterized protein LOC128687064 [Cherax quadricarinatus]